MGATLKQVNALLKAEGIPLELVRGEGYHYFVMDDGDKVFETESVMIPYTNHQSVSRWVNDARYALTAIRLRLERF